MSNKHHLSDSPTGRFSAFFMGEDGNVTILDNTARSWSFVLDENGTIDQLAEITDRPDRSDIDADDIRWLIHIFQSVETWLDHAPHDIARYGGVGVTC